MYQEVRDYAPLFDWMTESCANKQPYLVTLIDIDHFNSSRPDLTLDQRMEVVHASLQRHIPYGLLYLGRDELAFATQDERLEDCLLHLSLAKKQLISETDISFTASLAEFPVHGEDAIEVLRHLEETLFQAKKAGRNRISYVYERKMKTKNNYYTLTQFERLTHLSQHLQRSESSLLREALDMLLRKYEQ